MDGSFTGPAEAHGGNTASSVMHLQSGATQGFDDGAPLLQFGGAARFAADGSELGSLHLPAGGNGDKLGRDPQQRSRRPYRNGRSRPAHGAADMTHRQHSQQHGAT